MQIILLIVSCVISMVLLSGTNASAALLQSRSIQLGSSATSTTGGVNVTYKVSLTVDNVATNIGGLAIDFCSNSPLAIDPCTAPAALNTNKATLTVNNQTNISGLSVDTTNSTNNKLILTKTAAAPGAAAFSFELGNGTTNGFTNPSATGTYYARIYTYATSAAAQAHSTTAPTGFTDQGSVAISTAARISFDFSVPESLTFCVYTGVNCAAGGASIILGDTNGNLSTTGPFVDRSTKYDIVTNSGGPIPKAVIRLKADLPTSGLNTIASINAATPGVAAASAAGVSQFGLCSFAVSGALNIVAPYRNGANNGGICSGTTQTAGTGSTGGDNGALFAFEPEISGTYGDRIATYNQNTSATGQIAFIGNISSAQPAGIYTTTVSLIVTATY